MNMIVNLQRRIDAALQRWAGGGVRKHNHYQDYGWPENLTFTELHRMYTRNGLASAGVDRTIERTWQDPPSVWESESPAESDLESEIRQRFTRLRLWARFAEADRRSMVGEYAGVILRLADGEEFRSPVTRVPGGLEGLVEVIPVWQSQLTVSEWVTDPTSDDYGRPAMFQFTEAALGGNTSSPRSFSVHPDRVLVWSDDGTVSCRSALEPGFNDLMDAEKVKGAGGEGFWKSSRGAPIIEAPEGMTQADVAKAMGIDRDEFVDAVNEQLESFQSGFDKGLMIGGMTAKPLVIELPDPENFFGIAVQGFAASLRIPLKVLLGTQTGERASTEDAKGWSKTIMSRREMRNIPVIMEFVERLERFGILPENDWHVDWSDLTEDTAEDKINRASKMSEMNARTPMEPTFSTDELREAAGYEALEGPLPSLEDGEDEIDE